MATEKQLEYFKYIFEKENANQNYIVRKGQIYLSIITFYLGILIFKVGDKFNPESMGLDMGSGLKATYVIGFVFFFLAFITILLSIGHLHKYERPSNLVYIIKNFGEEPEKDEDFFDDRIVDFAVATERNLKTNNLRAKILAVATVFLVIGMLSHFIFYLASIIQ